VLVELIESAGSGKAFEHALVHGARIDARGEVGKAGKWLRNPRLDDRFDGLPADAFERGERIDDRLAVDSELDAGAVDRRGIDLDAEPLGFRAEFGELVG